MAKSEKVILPPYLYGILEKAGWDMTPFVVWAEVPQWKDNND